jgi:hypothetical protein
MKYYLFRAAVILFPLLGLILVLLFVAALILKLFQRSKPSGNKVSILLSKELKEKYMAKYGVEEPTKVDNEKEEKVS